MDDARVYMRTTEGPKRVDVVYRRIDDDIALGREIGEFYLQGTARAGAAPSAFAAQ